MKKLLHLLIPFLTLLFLTLLPLQTAFATVGGAAVYDDFYYLPTENEIWFAHYQGDGMGCTDLKKYSLKNHQTNIEIDCKGNNISQAYEDIEARQKELAETAIKLQEVDLEKIDIRFESKFDSENFFSELDTLSLTDHYFWYETQQITWKITPIIDNNSQTSFFVPSCIRETPINFSGLASPSHDFLVIIGTTISQCYETGYADDTLTVLKNVTLAKNTFKGDLTSSYTFPEESYIDTISPLPRKIFHQPDFQTIHTYLNTVGFQAYQEGSYEIAIHFFQRAYTDTYLLPLFNLAATEAKISKFDKSFDHIDKLLSHQDTYEHYLDKITNDSDFDGLRNDKRYLTYFPNATISEKTPEITEKDPPKNTEDNTVEKTEEPIQDTTKKPDINLPPPKQTPTLTETPKIVETSSTLPSNYIIYLSIAIITFLFGFLIAKKKK